MTAPIDDSLPAMEFMINVADGDWFEEDPRWRTRRAELFAELRAAPGTSVRPASKGGKGAADAIIIALGSAGAFSAMVKIFQAWLGGRPRRSITITLKHGESSVVIDEKSLSEAELARWMERFASGHFIEPS